MFSNEFLKGFRSAVQAYGMNKPRGAYDARPSFTPRKRASDQFNEEEQAKASDRGLPNELLDLLRTQLNPDTYQMLTDALNGRANDQEDDQPATDLSPDLIAKISELVAPHLSDGDNAEFQQLLDGLSDKRTNDEPSPISSASRAQSKSPAEDARRIKSLTPGGELAYDNGTPFTGERNGVRYLEGVRLNHRRRTVSGSALQSYAKRFPNAARIKAL
jgi:hypothetical protein